jgi:hypothetical protein
VWCGVVWCGVVWCGVVWCVFCVRVRACVRVCVGVGVGVGVCVGGWKCQWWWLRRHFYLLKMIGSVIPKAFSIW